MRRSVPNRLVALASSSCAVGARDRRQGDARPSKNTGNQQTCHRDAFMLRPMRLGMLASMAAACGALTGCGNMGSARVTGACAGVRTARESRSFLVVSEATVQLTRRIVCANLGAPRSASNEPGGTVLWRYFGRTIVFKRDRIIGMAGVTTIRGPDLGGRIRSSTCSATADECIVFLTDGRRLRCPGSGLEAASDRVGGDVVVNKRCALIGPG
jgi:hypothetical protein